MVHIRVGQEMSFDLAFPAFWHEEVARTVVRFFEGRGDAQAVLVIASCARGAAERESDLDMAVLIAPDLAGKDREALERQWSFSGSSEAVRHLTESSRFATLHLDLIDGAYQPTQWGDDGPNDFELEIGNHVAYAMPLWQRSRAFR